MIVYLFTNTVNGKRYVGQTVKPLTGRWQRHLASAKAGSKYLIHKAIRKYGAEAFKRETLFTCSDKTTLDLYEKGHIQFFKSRAPNGYNLTDGGEGNLNPPEEIRKKLGETWRGKSFSEQHRQNLSASHKGKRQPHSAETCLNISKAKTGRSNGLLGMKRGPYKVVAKTADPVPQVHDDSIARSA
jgi:group I intron endonuclease